MIKIDLMMLIFRQEKELSETIFEVLENNEY